MNSVEARSKGLPWTDFKEIPPVFRNLYNIILALNPLADMMVKQTGEYEMCCEYWFNNTLLIAEGHIKEDEGGRYMEEIKFRQAILKDGKFHHWHFWGYVGHDREFVAPIKIWQQSSPPTYGIKESQLSSGWHTGTLELGKEVYEGDILTSPSIKDEFLPYVVKFGKYTDIAEAGCTTHNNIGFYLEDAHGDQVGLLNQELLTEWDSFEIVGSIHETPELLANIKQD